MKQLSDSDIEKIKNVIEAVFIEGGTSCFASIQDKGNVDDALFNTHKERYVNYYTERLTEIAAQAAGFDEEFTAKFPKWNYVRNKLPNDGQWVIGAQDDGIFVYSIFKFLDGKFMPYGQVRSEEKINYWLAIPEDPVESAMQRQAAEDGYKSPTPSPDNPKSQEGISGWGVYTNENGVVIATINRDQLVNLVSENERLKSEAKLSDETKFNLSRENERLERQKNEAWRITEELKKERNEAIAENERLTRELEEATRNLIESLDLVSVKQDSCNKLSKLVIALRAELSKQGQETVEFAEWLPENHYYLYNINTLPDGYEYQWKSQEEDKPGKFSSAQLYDLWKSTKREEGRNES